MPSRTKLGTLANTRPAEARAQILASLDATGGDAQASAAQLTVSRKQLYNLIDKLGLADEIEKRRASGKYAKSGGPTRRAKYSRSGIASRLRGGY